MGKGLADIETKRLINSISGDESVDIPNEFWCYDSLSKEEDCCFWHFVFFPNGGPERDGVHHPVYEYEQILLQNLAKYKCLAVYKATGLGITEFMLLWILWKSLTDEFFYGKEAIIITGPNVDLAQGLILRAKTFLLNKEIDFVDKGVYELSLNGSDIKCYPSNNIHSARGKPKISIFFGDEAAFFKMKDDNEVRTVGERYIGKSDSWVVWVSTAGEEPQGFFWNIMNEHNSIYKKLEFYETWGLKKDHKTGTSIFKDEFIKNARLAPSYPREYLGQWGKNVGDIFSSSQLEAISAENFEVDPENDSYDRVIFLDPGFGSSNFGILIGQRVNGIPSVVYSQSYPRQAYTFMLKEIEKLSNIWNTTRIRCDNQWPEGIKDLRENLGFDVVGYSFKELGKNMTDAASRNVGKLKIRIHPSCRNLIHQLMTIKYNKNNMPDKTHHNPFDEGDCFLMFNWYFLREGGFIEIVY